MITLDVPALPPLPDDVLADHAAAHGQLDTALDSEAPAVRALFRLLQHRIVVESLANAQPVLSGVPLLFPAPRTFLAGRLERRMSAVAAAVRHVDARGTMLAGGLVDRVIDASTPVALHALIESSNPTGRETNPGMLRATPTGWIPDVNPFVHAEGPECPRLVAAAIDLAVRAPAPAVARAGWLTFTMLSIHPFVDGNGRTSRVLFHAIAGTDLRLGFDWGIAEQWTLFRDEYVTTLQEGQRVGAYVPAELDAMPFMTFSARASTAGARLCTERVRLLATEFAAVTAAGADADVATVLVAVRLQRIATLRQLERLGLDDDRLVAVVEALVGAGRLRWVARHAGWRTAEHPDAIGLAAV